MEYRESKRWNERNELHNREKNETKLILNYCMVKKNKHGIILCLVIRLFTAATGF